MLEAAIAVRDHQVDQLGVRRHAKDLRTVRAQAVLIALAPIYEDVEAVIVLPQRNQRIVTGIGASAERDDGIGQTA